MNTLDEVTTYKFLPYTLKIVGLEAPVINKPEHPLTEEGLKRAYNNLREIFIHPDDLESIS